MSATALNLALDLALKGESLTREQAARMMDEVTSGTASAEQVSAMLTALRLKNETVDEIVGFVTSLKKQARACPHSFDDLIDVCGTGGDGLGTFNVSTTVSFVVAACGQPVAKHGNRSVSSRSGSFDVLHALGIAMSDDVDLIVNSIKKFNLGLLFAPSFHPVLKNLSTLRKNLGIRTVFNLLGPLLNPMSVRRQVIGVYDGRLLDKINLVLRELGHTEAMVIHGEGGIDEFSISGPTQVSHLKNGELKKYSVTPEDVGLKSAPLESLLGGSAEENAAIILSVLRGEKGPRRDVVLLNAAAALVVGGKASSLKEGAAMGAEAIDSGRALEVLGGMRSHR